MTVPVDTRLGDLLVSVGRPSVAFYPPGTTHGPRQPDAFEFVWVLQGFAEWESGRLRHALTPGTLLLVRPGMRDRFRWDVRRPSRLGQVRFGLANRAEPDGPAGLAHRAEPDGPAGLAGGGPDTTGWPVVRLTGPDDPLRGLTRYLLWLGSHESERFSAAIHETLGLLLTLFVRGPLPGANRNTGLPAALDPVLDHVRAAWASGTLRPLSRTELARAGAMSPGHLSRIFREHCGVGAVAAFELLRLVRAEMLLRGSDMSVRMVAQLCGFADPYHFSHRFKAAYGVSPRNFRDGVASGQPDPGTVPGVRLLAYRLWGTVVPRPDVGR